MSTLDRLSIAADAEGASTLSGAVPTDAIFRATRPPAAVQHALATCGAKLAAIGANASRPYDFVDGKLVRTLTPVLRANHNWAIARAMEGLDQCAQRTAPHPSTASPG